ncbi:EF-P 5-aminopentanol modification-associated protein YfmF [Anaerotignum propionicum]|uniref:Peptidase M16 inactive domain protein n=2 Tax=root TaxID=1 RepID=A0A110A745_ANAPI|nr:pitrilysin family protein [Anaerotignum propionicum]AMJ40018.1 peptidase M16 inactive domain protein [Anaerotignum propionicum DSM 1682]SHE78747.1 Predicted Zn-dependent peptidase [[Clostridium] propionicum DSM 1682] [Anaerotignum propionicum DSM 1682]
MYSLERNTPRCRIFWLDGKKFKTNLFLLFFELPLRRETATKTALLAEVLREGSKAYPDARRIATAAEEMYGALWDISIVKKGEKQLLVFSLETAKAVDTEESIGFLKALSSEPLVDHLGFPEAVVNRRKEIMARKLAALKDDKQDYARRRCLQEAAKGTPLEISADGYEEDLDEIDGKTLYDYYCKIIEHAPVKIFFCGDEGEKRKLTVFRKIFQGGEPLESLREVEQSTRQEPVFVRENTPMEQARLLLAFDTKAEWGKRSYGTMLVLNQLFGGDPDSLLFQNLRERDGLCYDIKSFSYPLTGLLFVQTGINVQDAKKSAKGILHELEKLGQDVVEEKKLEQAKTALLRQYRTIADQPWAMADFSVEQVLGEGERGLEPFLRRIRNVTAEEVSRMANKAVLKAIYLLSGQEVAKDEGK